jgi:hypothetical protein
MPTLRDVEVDPACGAYPSLSVIAPARETRSGEWGKASALYSSRIIRDLWKS